ncbi:hypothetical protein VTG60DRAFT_5783 [Thermothelomyces hinnuleus]
MPTASPRAPPPTMITKNPSPPLSPWPFCARAAFTGIASRQPWRGYPPQTGRYHTGWPADPSLECLDRFTCLVQSFSPDETPEAALDVMLRSTPKYEEMRWILGWVICAYRPFSADELADLLRCRRGEVVRPTSTSARRTLTAEYRRELWVWLRMLADFDGDRATIRPDVREILDRPDTRTGSFTWSEVMETAHQTILDFCLTYLVSEEAQSFLESLFFRSPLAAHQQQGPESKQPAFSTIPDGETVLFYVVQALPYHLSKCPSAVRDRVVDRLLSTSATYRSNSPYTLWARAYWATSSPFSRPSEPPNFPLPVLTGLGLLSYETVKGIPARVHEQCLVAAAAGRSSATLVDEYLQKEAPGPAAMPFLTELLLSAVHACNEQLAVDIVGKIAVPPPPGGDTATVRWPDSAVWATAWLDMSQLAAALLSRGASPDPQDASRETRQETLKPAFLASPLHLACCVGHDSVVKIFAGHNAHLDVLRGGIYGCFQEAASRGHVGVLKQLYSESPSLLESRRPCSGLFHAASLGNWAAVEALIDLGADMEARQGSENLIDTETLTWSPLAIACSRSNPRVTEVLLKRGVDANSLGTYDFNTPLWTAAFQSHSVECVRALLERGADPNHERFSRPFVLEMVDSPTSDDVLISVGNALLKFGERPMNLEAAGNGGKTALMSAAEAGRLPLVRWLLENGADINALDEYGEVALHYAVRAGRMNVVQELLLPQYQPKLDVVGRVPLLHLALDKPEMLKLLLNAGADPNIEDSSKNTLINLASNAGNVEVVEILIANKADIHHVDCWGWSPILDAVGAAKNAPVTRLLVDNGAELRTATRHATTDGRNILHYAVEGPLEIMKTLLEHAKYLELDGRDESGQTPLLYGSCRDWANLDCLRLLILAGADVNAKGQTDGTPPSQRRREPPDCSALPPPRPARDRG